MSSSGSSRSGESERQIDERAAKTRDETADGRDVAADLRDQGADERDVLARRAEHEASDRDQSWSDDDQASSGRDQLSADADQEAADIALAAGGDRTAHEKSSEARAESRSERGAVSQSRGKATAARAELEKSSNADGSEALLSGQSDRAMAAYDRVEAARDREQSALNRALSESAAQRAIETLESMSDAFFTLDSEWRFTYLNPQTESLINRAREDLIGKRLWDEFPSTVGSRFEAEYRRAVRDHVPVRFEETYEPLGVTFEVRAHPAAGGLAIYFTDVTEERLRDARRRQSERLETLGQLTTGIVHDFRNLLGVVAGYASLGQQEAVEEGTREYFDEIATASEKAKALTGQLLAFARQQDLSPALIDMNEVVDGLSSILHQLMPYNIRLHLALSEEPVVVFVDPSQLEQVIINLAVNSRDSIDGSGTVTVTTTPHHPRTVEHDIQGPFGGLQVTDTGSGIPPEVLPRIFDPFFSTKAQGEGSGLGLATIYGIVTQSGGSIFVDSTVDEGTTMTVALPGAPAVATNPD